MRIAAWNMGHQTREAPISSRLVDALAHIDADVLTLNEFVDGESRRPLHLMLKSLGFGHVLVSQRHGVHNQVLVASRHPLSVGDIPPPTVPTNPGSAESNFLHVQLKRQGCSVDVLAVRAPAYKSVAETQSYWKQLRDIAFANIERPLVLIGDLNADPDNARSPGGAYLREMEARGFAIPRAEGAWSFWRGSRIDHAVLAPGLTARRASYLTTIGDWNVASSDKSTCISDHAALLIDLSS